MSKCKIVANLADNSIFKFCLCLFVDSSVFLQITSYKEYPSIVNGEMLTLPQISSLMFKIFLQKSNVSIFLKYVQKKNSYKYYRYIYISILRKNIESIFLWTIFSTYT